MIHRFSNAGLGTACFALLIGSAIVVLPLASAEAAPKERARPAATLNSAQSKLADAEPATTGSIAAPPSDAQASCDRVRRRLWVEGEGWVVRRVTTCQLTEN